MQVSNIQEKAREYFKEKDENNTDLVDKEELRHFFFKYAEENGMKAPLETDFAQENDIHETKNERQFTSQEFCELVGKLSSKLRHKNDEPHTSTQN